MLGEFGKFRRMGAVEKTVAEIIGILAQGAFAICLAPFRWLATFAAPAEMQIEFQSEADIGKLDDIGITALDDMGFESGTRWLVHGEKLTSRGGADKNHDLAERRGKPAMQQ